MVGNGEYLGEFPIHFIFFIRAKMGDNYEIWWETGQLASWWTYIFIVFLRFDSQIHQTFVKFCFQRFLTLLLLMKVLEIYKTKSYKYSMNLWIKSKENYK